MNITVISNQKDNFFSWIFLEKTIAYSKFRIRENMCTLSGLMWHRRHKIITATMTSPNKNEAIEAVTTAEAHKSKVWSRSSSPPIIMAIPVVEFSREGYKIRN